MKSVYDDDEWNKILRPHGSEWLFCPCHRGTRLRWGGRGYVCPDCPSREEEEKMRIINCTPHPIVVRSESGTDTVITPSGMVPRVGMITMVAPDVDGLECITQSWSDVVGLPNPVEGVFFLVSGLVFRASDRQDLLAPDTGTCIRDDQGRIIAVRRLIRKE